MVSIPAPSMREYGAGTLIDATKLACLRRQYPFEFSGCRALSAGTTTWRYLYGHSIGIAQVNFNSTLLRSL
jgi:hypothetical protein